MKASLYCLPGLWTISSVIMYTWCSHTPWRPPHLSLGLPSWPFCCVTQGRLHFWWGSDSQNTLKLASMDIFQFPRTLDRAKPIVKTAGQHVALGRSSVILHPSGSWLQWLGVTLGENENSIQKNLNPAGTQTQGCAVRQVCQKTMHLSIICLVNMLLGFKLRR